MTADAEELRALIPCATETSKPRSASSADGRCNSNSLNIRDRCRASEQTDISRERWLETRLALLSLKTLDERRLFAADVRSSPTMQVNVEVISATTSVFAEESGLVGLVNGLLNVRSLLVEFSANVNVSCAGIHGATSDETAFDELVRISTQNLTVLAGTRFTLVGVHDEIPWSRVLLPTWLVHETPLETTGKASTTTPTQARVFHCLDDPRVALEENVLGSVPITAGQSTLNPMIMLQYAFVKIRSWSLSPP